MSHTPLKFAENQAKAFSKETLLINHDWHLDKAFDDDGLIKLINAYPYEGVEIFTMGHDPVKTKEWYFGDRGKHDGAALMDGVRRGRLWINLRKAQSVDPYLNELMQALFGQINQETGVTTLKPDMGVLISSPGAQVFYHLDMPLVMLFQLRGQKKVYLYPPKAPYVDQVCLEGLALRENDELMPYDPSWDQDAFSHSLNPGEMITWAQNAPHRIVNEVGVNVSLSIEFMTPKALLHANRVYANGYMRRRFGMISDNQKPLGAIDMMRALYARILKSTNAFPSGKSPLVKRFSLDQDDPAVIHFQS
jgi:hypothetical protein